MSASEKQLGDLHKEIANAFTEQVAGYDEPIINAEGEDTGVTKKVRPSPALLAAAVTFLKNNNITADANKNTALIELNEALAAKRKGRASQATLDQAAEAYANAQGFLMQ